MANPFGSADEALSKNTGHTNQANLIYAYIPRSTTKFVEVINAAVVNPTAGNYDADGYWRSANTTANLSSYTLPAARSAGQAQTLIIGLRYNSAGGGSGSLILGLNASGGDANNRFHCRPYVYSRALRGYITDNAGNTINALNGSLFDPGADTCAYAMKGNTSALLQSAFTRQPGVSSTPAGSDTSSTPSGSDGGLDQLHVKLTNKWAFQYIFIYNAVLSDADIEAIIDDPGSVITQGGGGGAAALMGQACL